MGGKAVILLSGGLDSCTCMAVARAAGYELYPISFDYHQRHDRELDSAKRIAAHYHVAEHLIIETNMNAIGGSALTDDSIAVPAGDADRTEIPVTYVPARNLIFLSYALAFAERVGATHLYIGVNSVDYSGYSDCRPEFIAAFQAAADAATAAATERGRRIVVETPLQHLSKGEIVRLGTELGAPYELTTSCYRGGVEACGVCDSCVLRLRGFAEAGRRDPIPYAAGVR
ncbi:7-cyano-7-deazaguanine synthase QueC [uncultured Selenomonas sp.]|uniref:7-cyano-7-deazaguanine synthase QueC n=1 Tax=uncultured Selenomonas sp. TaxID=159275 RepID=UPI0028E559DB|nr:7-cyano-7-deazaguanine synthase QueC [uncultured Selenomonas sp.]